MIARPAFCLTMLGLSLLGGIVDARAQEDMRGFEPSLDPAPRRRPAAALDTPPRDGAGLKQRQQQQVRRPVVSPNVRPGKPAELRPNKAVRSLGPAVAPGLSAPVPAPKKRPADNDPYQPLGLRLGNILLNAGAESSAGYDDNTARANTGKKGSLLYREALDLKLKSDWSNHELSGDMRGAYTWFPDVQSANRPEFQGRLGLRLDATRDTQIFLETRAAIDSQRPTSPDLNAAVKSRPLTYAYGASLGVTQHFNRFVVGLRGSVDRSSFEDATLANGARLDQSTRNLNAYALRLRAGYELTPGFVPFVDATIDSRDYDKELDASGIRRSSRGLAVRAGTTLEMTRTLKGEIAAGYGTRSYDDASLKDLRGPVAEASLTWVATPLTTLTLRGATSFDETTLVGSPGSLGRRISLDINHQLLRNLALGANASFTNAHYIGLKRDDDTVQAGLKAQYRFSRNLSLTGSYTYERAFSSLQGQGYRSNLFMLGVKGEL